MENFKETILSTQTPTLVQFSAEWCGPCQAMGPIVDKVKTNVGSKAKVLKVDVDQYNNLASEYHIQTVPTFIIFKQGEALWRHSGMIQEKELTAMLENYF